MEEIDHFLCADVGIEEIERSFTAECGDLIIEPLAGFVFGPEHFTRLSKDSRHTQTLFRLVRGENSRSSFPQGLGVDVQLARQGFFAEANRGRDLLEDLSGDSLPDRLDLGEGRKGRHGRDLRWHRPGM